MTEEKLCPSCEQPVIEKYPACPLQCMSPKCKAYQSLKIDFSKKPIIWILGGPGCGKGTQCRKISTKYGFTHLSTGDLLRAEVKKGTERSTCIANMMQRGELVPNDIVLNLLNEALKASAPKAKGFLIDGYPREKEQGAAFERIVGPPNLIIYLETSDKTLTERLLKRAATYPFRLDDTEDIIKLRLKIFYEYNDLVLAQYADKVHRINADPGPDEIFEEVQKILDPVVQAMNVVN